MAPNLPDQILGFIISYIDSPRTALNVALACRKFHAMCDVLNRAKYERARLKYPGDADRLLTMTLSILRTPKLGTYVRHFDMGQSLYARGYPSARQMKFSRAITDEERELLQQGVSRIVFVDSKNRERMLSVLVGIAQVPQTGVTHVLLPQALAALFISICPNLESLGLSEISSPATTRDSGYKYLLEVFLEDAAAHQGEISYLQNVRDVECLPNDEPMWYDVHYYEGYDIGAKLHLMGPFPSVNKLSADGIAAGEDRSSVPPQSTNFRHLSIHHSKLSSQELAMVVASCRRLDVFEYSVGWKLARGESGVLILVELLDALLRHAATLHTVDLDIGNEGCEDSDHPLLRREKPTDPDVPPNNGCTSLKHCSAMRHLSAGIWALLVFASRDNVFERCANDEFLLVDNLPPNLESLTIRGYERGEDEMYDRQIDSLIENQHRFPSLREIDGVDDPYVPDSMTVLQEDLAYVPEERDFDIFEECFK